MKSQMTTPKSVNREYGIAREYMPELDGTPVGDMLAMKSTYDDGKWIVTPFPDEMETTLGSETALHTFLCGSSDEMKARIHEETEQKIMYPHEEGSI